MSSVVRLALIVLLAAAPLARGDATLGVIAHHFEIDRSARVRWAGGGLVVDCAGETLFADPYALKAATLRISGTASTPELQLGQAAGPLPAARAERIPESAWRGLPHRDRMMFGHGLRTAHVAGAARNGSEELYWYGTAATGITVRAGDQWRDIATSFHVFDADVAEDGTIWAASSQGLVRVPRDGDAQRIATRAYRPGNALDGAFVHDAQMHVFGPRGLYHIVPLGPSPMWVPLTEGVVRDARSTPRGVAALTGGHVWFYPGPQQLSKRMPGGIWFFGWTAEHKMYLATAAGLYAWDPARFEPVLDVFFGAPPRALACGKDTIALAHAGPEPWVWIGREIPGQGMGPTLRGARVELGAWALRLEPSRILAGTDDGLASIEGDRVHWFYRKPGLKVTAVERMGSGHYALATSEGILVLDGPTAVARNPLGSGGGPARVTALVAMGQDLYATTSGHGLYRLRLAGAGAAGRVDR